MAEDFSVDDASDQGKGGTLLASAAIHRWQKAKLKASFKKQLSEILEDVTSEEKVTKKLKQQLRAAHTREDELLQRMSDIKAELKNRAVQTSQQRADILELTTALEALEVHAAALQQRAEDAEAAHAAEIHRSTALNKQQQQELRSSKQEQQDLLNQHQALLSSLAQRDQQVAQLALDLKAAKATATDAVQQFQQLEGVVQATGERAAAAEDGLRTSHELVVNLQQQLAELKDRYHTELAGLASLRAAAAESAALKDRLAEASAAAAGLAAAQDEMRSMLDAANAALAASSEQKRQLEKAADIKQALQHAGLAGDLVGELAQQLEDTRAQVTVLSPKLAAAEAAVQQQQRHIQQLAVDLEQARGARAAAAERSEVLQVLNVQLQAEAMRLAALAGVQVGVNLAGHSGVPAGTHMGQQLGHSHTQKARNSAALLLSQLQECHDNLDATKRSMMRSRPKVTAAARQAAAASALVAQAATLLQQTIATLRPDQQQQREPHVIAAVVHSAEQQLTAVLGQQAAQQQGVLEGLQLQLQQEQQHWQQVLLAAATAEKAVQEVAEVVSSACGLVPSGAGLSDSMVEALRGHTQQLSSIEQQLASALEYTSSSHLGEEVCVLAEVAARDICTLLLDLSALLGSTADLAATSAAPEGPDGPEAIGLIMGTVSAKLVVAASRATDKLKVIRSCSTSLSSSLAELSSVTAYLHTAQQQAGAAASQLQQLQQLHQEQQDAHSSGAAPAATGNNSHRKLGGHTKTAEVAVGAFAADAEAAAALQLEVAALTLQLERREREVQQLMTREKQLLSGTSELVPAELLAAARRHQDDLTQHITALQQQMVQQTAAQQYAAGVYIERVTAKQKVSWLVTAWLRWRAAAVEGRADRLSIELCEAQAALQHAAELQQLRFKALAALLKRHGKAAAAEQQLQLETAVVVAWQRQATRQIHATWLWRGLSELLLQQTSLSAWAQQQQQQKGSPGPTHQQWGDTISSVAPQQYNPGPSSLYSSKGACLAAVLLWRKRHPQGSCMWSVRAVQLLSLVFRAWRSCTQLESSTRTVQQRLAHVEQLSSSLPIWVQQLGDKRRLERGWLACRLAAAAAAAAAGKPALHKAQQQAVAAAADARQSEDEAVRSRNAVTVTESRQNELRPFVFSGHPSWQVAQDLDAGGHIPSPVVSTVPASNRENTIPTTNVPLIEETETSLPGIGRHVYQVEAALPPPQGDNSTHQRLQQRLLGAGVGMMGTLASQHPSASQQGPAPISATNNLHHMQAAVSHAAQQQQQLEQTAGSPVTATTAQGHTAVQTARQDPVNKQQQRISLRNKNSSVKTTATTLAASVQAGRSPPAGLRVKASERHNTGTTSPQLVVARPSAASPGAAVPGRAAFGPTLKAGDWAPVPGVRNSGLTGKVNVAGLAARIGASSPTARATVPWSAAGSRKQQQQSSHAQQGPTGAVGAAGGVEAPVASSVHDHLAAISSSLTTLQQQVQVRSRALFQAGADALHPGAVSSEAADQQPPQQQQQQQLLKEVLMIQSRQPGSTAGLTAGQQPGQVRAAEGGSVATTAAVDGMTQSTDTVSGLQQQLMGCQQHLQQLTSSLHIASRPWLHPPTEATPAAGIPSPDGDQATHPDRPQPTSSILAVGGGPHKQPGVPAAANSDSISSSSKTFGSAAASGQTASAGASIQVQVEGRSTGNVIPTAPSPAANSREAVTSTGDVREGVDVAAATGQQEVEVTDDMKAAPIPGSDRQLSPAVVVDTRSAQVTAGEKQKQAAADDRLSNAKCSVADVIVLPEWHVLGQPRKTLLQSAAAATATKGSTSTTGSTASHPLSVPLSTYVTSHSSTPGPGSHTPPRSQLHEPGTQAQGNPLAVDATGMEADTRHLLSVASSSPVPQLSTSIPQPYKSAARLRHAYCGPQPAASQQQTGQTHAAAATQLSTCDKAQTAYNELQQGCRVPVPAAASAAAYPEPGVVRFERISRSGVNERSGPAQQLQLW